MGFKLPTKLLPKPAPKPAPKPVAKFDATAVVMELVTDFKSTLSSNEYIAVLHEMREISTNELSHAKTAPVSSNLATDIDGAEVHSRFSSGEDINVLSRKELVALSIHLGAADVDVRGKPIKELRKVVEGLAATSTLTASPPKPVKRFKLG